VVDGPAAICNVSEGVQQSNLNKVAECACAPYRTYDALGIQDNVQRDGAMSASQTIDSDSCRFMQYGGGKILDELKQIRSRMGKLKSRVLLLKKELEDVLKDDQDMLDMLLERRHVLEERDMAQGYPDMYQQQMSQQLSPTTQLQTALSPIKLRPGVSSENPSAPTSAAPATHSFSGAGAVPQTNQPIVPESSAHSGPEAQAVEHQTQAEKTEAPASSTAGDAAANIAADEEGTDGDAEEQGGARMSSGTLPWLGTPEELKLGFGSVLSPHDADALSRRGSRTRSKASSKSSEPTAKERCYYLPSQLT
jgi:hypothetical protein